MFKLRHVMLTLGLPLMLLAAPVRADDPLTADWITQSGRPRYDYFGDVALGGADSIFVLGAKSTPGPDDPSNTIGVVRRYDLAGTQVWERDFHASDLAADSSANVYLAGASDQDRDGFTNGFLQKLSSDGLINWTRTFGNSDGDPVYSRFDVLSQDTLGNLYVTGLSLQNESQISQFDFDVLVGKYDVDGALLWMRQFGSAGTDYVSSISADAFGNVFLGGRTEGSLSGENAGSSDKFLAKYNDEGEMQWLHQFGTPDTDSLMDLETDGFGNVFATEGTGTLSGNNTVMVSKYDSDGVQLWSRDIGVNNGADIVEVNSLFADESGNVYVAGATTLSLGAPNAGTRDAFVQKYDSQGTVLWTYQFGSNRTDHLSDGAVDEEGRLVLVGTTDGSLTVPNPNFSNDAWIALFHENPDIPLPGDTNGDGLVDLEDLNNVRNHFGGAGLGDTAPFDGVVDLNDLNAVRNNFGASIVPNAVPEPSSVLLLFLGGVGLAVGRVAQRVSRVSRVVAD
jgi:hypothetical protein